jgi:hypothetical protein
VHINTHLINTSKSLRVRVTYGYEDNAMINYSAIRSITKQAAKAFSFTMDEVIELMTAIHPLIGTSGLACFLGRG